MRTPGAILTVLIVLGGTGATAEATDASCFEASAWPEADALFHGDPNWIGADGAYSIDLGNDRTLWLFADTWLDPSGQRSRRDARMIRNSAGIQTGADPSTASIHYHWQQTADGVPQAFFSREDDEWFWPGHGIRLGDKLVIFLNRLRGTDVGLGFASAGWNAVMIENPDDEPSDWKIRTLETPTNSLGILVGFAGVLQQEGFLYAFGSLDPVKSHPIYVARWPVEKVIAEDLMNPEWWGGEGIGWITDASWRPRWPIFENGQSELTVHFDNIARQFVAIHTVGFGKADVGIRSAEKLTGPWTPAEPVYRPPEYDRPNVMIYAAKAHPQFTGADAVLTYANNSFIFRDHLTDQQIYYPHFVRLTRCE